MKFLELSHNEAKHIMLIAQGIQDTPQAPVERSDLLEAIRRMGLLQIDTISVVARSPYLVLRSRLGDYPMHWLEELLAEGHLFEYWSHAACFLPREDFALYSRLMIEYEERLTASRDKADEGGGWWSRMPNAEERVVIDRVLERIRVEGAVRSAEFEREEGKGGGWWNWKPEKLALERLFNAGTLVIARREGFQRVYDLRERVLPEWDDTQSFSREVGTRQMILKAVKALGVAQANWVPAYFPDYLRKRNGKKGIVQHLEALAKEGLLLTVSVEGWAEPAYVHHENLNTAKQVTEGMRSIATTLLSPFDPLISDRARAEKVFDFFYRIEVYTPAPKRRYGYFSLPILYQGELVGRLDAKAHRKEGRFEVRNLHLEPRVTITEGLATALAETVIGFANWHGTPEITVLHSDPPEFLPRLQSALKALRAD